MNLNYDCIQRIMMFSNPDTIANCLMVSKQMNTRSVPFRRIHLFHLNYEKAIKDFQQNKKKENRKKRLLYNIYDILVEHQDLWRLVRPSDTATMEFSRTIHSHFDVLMKLSYVPAKKKLLYSTKLKKWQAENQKCKEGIYV